MKHPVRYNQDKALVAEWDRLTAALAQVKSESRKREDYEKQLDTLDAARKRFAFLDTRDLQKYCIDRATIDGLQERLDYIHDRVIAARLAIDAHDLQTGDMIP